MCQRPLYYLVGLWCLTLLQEYFSFIVTVSCIWWGKPEAPENTTDLSQIGDKLYHIMMYRVHLTFVLFGLQICWLRTYLCIHRNRSQGVKTCNNCCQKKLFICSMVENVHIQARDDFSKILVIYEWLIDWS